MEEQKKRPEEEKRTQVMHPIPPVWNAESRVLVLGSFPSVKSREQNFFYGHKQNRFWRVLAAVLETEVPETMEEKKRFLLNARIAVWDVIGSCTIVGSSDASIKDVKPNNLSEILDRADIRQIYCNGAKSYELFNRYLYPVIGREAEKLPSTSPANAAKTTDMLVSEWKQLRNLLQQERE